MGFMVGKKIFGKKIWREQFFVPTFGGWVGLSLSI
jgi:hypothetical protein